MRLNPITILRRYLRRREREQKARRPMATYNRQKPPYRSPAVPPLYAQVQRPPLRDLEPMKRAVNVYDPLASLDELDPILERLNKASAEFRRDKQMEPEIVSRLRATGGA